MISKRYYYVISLGIASNFYIRADPANTGRYVRGPIVADELGNLGSPSIDP